MNNQIVLNSRPWSTAGSWCSAARHRLVTTPLAPLYNHTPPAVQANPGIYYSAVGAINIASVPPTTNVQSAQQTFDQRAAAAIFQAAGVPFSSDSTDKGEGYQSTLAAKYAYAEFFPDDATGAHRNDANSAILAHSAGQEGTDISSGSHDEYDFCLNYYLPVLCRYYSAMPANVSDYMINHLLSDATRSGIPTGRSGVGPLEDPWSEFIHVPDIVDVPETENHLLGIETARYLANQLPYQRTQDSSYDNVRNGVVDWLLAALQGSLANEVQGYDARPYEDMDMSALLNLASYAYDGRIRLGGTMVLDYLSAKVAVSSYDLRRAAPFRRRNELEHYRPTIGDSAFLASPLDYYGGGFEPDPQTGFYALLAANTSAFAGTVPGNFNWEMIHDGLYDYRVPYSILDLLVTEGDRRFYQFLRHGAGNGEFGLELYAGFPSYLLSAGAHPTSYCYLANVQWAAQAVIDLISYAFGGVPGVLLEQFVETSATGDSSDLGSALPSFFLPRNAHSLQDVIQFGGYTTDESHDHLGVAPDVLYGEGIYLPDWFDNAAQKVTVGNWTFVNEGGAEGQPGFYLALYAGDDGNGGQAGFLEAYDTWLHLGHAAVPTFTQFYQAVLNANVGASFDFSNNKVNTCTTQSGVTIQFTASSSSQIVTTTAMSPAPADNQTFAAGTIMQSDNASAPITIRNPVLGTAITLDMRDLRHPRRTSESGQVETGGQEVWVNFNYGNGSGDFAQPYRNLHSALLGSGAGIAPTVVNIMAGSEAETITLSQPVTLVAVGGPVTISSQ